MTELDRRAEAIAALARSTVLVVGANHERLATALSSRGVRAEGRAELTGAVPPCDLVVWAAPATPTPDFDAKEIVAALSRVADLVCVLDDGAAIAWRDHFVAANFVPEAETAGMSVFRRGGAVTEAASLRRELRRRVEQLDGLYRLLDEKDRTVAALRRDLAGLQSTLGWRALERLRALRARALAVAGLREAYWVCRRAVEVLLDEGVAEVVRKSGHKLGLALRGRSFLVSPRRRLPADLNDQYQLWLDRERRVDGGRRATPEHAGSGPVVSLLTVLDPSETGVLEAALDGMRAQRYPHWELCVATPAATSELEGLARREPRLRLAEAEHAGMADAFRVATGELLGVVDVRDVLHPDALLELVQRLADAPDHEAVYSDEDVLDDERRVEPFFKPAWSPELLLATNYVCRLGLVRRQLVEAVGGVRPEMGEGAAYDLWLRVGERARAIAHVPKVLYHRRIRMPTVAGVAADERTREMECRAVADALERRGLDGTVETLPAPFGVPAAFAARLQVRGRPLVSIIIPTRDKLHLLDQTIQSIRQRTSYDHYEIIVVDNDSREAATLKYLNALAAPCRTLRWPGAFNFSAINNAGAQHAKGEHLLFLNNDVEVLRPDWLVALLEHSQRPEVGAVGAKLLYPDGRIQHAGVVVGVGGLAVHAFRLWPGEPSGAYRLADLVRNCSAVTAACTMMRRGVFEQVGGFDEQLRVVFNDVDLCLRVLEAGYRVVYTPQAVLTHYEGASRGRLHPTPEEKLFRARWVRVLGATDPYYNPNLTATRDDWSLNLD